MFIASDRLARLPSQLLEFIKVEQGDFFTLSLNERIFLVAGEISTHGFNGKA
jgi:hypothetical protein